MLKLMGALGALLSRPEPRLVVQAVRRLVTSAAAQTASATVIRHVKHALQTGVVEVVLDLARPSPKDTHGRRP